MKNRQLGIQKILNYKEYMKLSINDESIYTIHLDTQNNQLPFIEESNTIAGFVEDFYKAELVVKNYNDVMEEMNLLGEPSARTLESVNLTQNHILAIITAIIRGDRFCEGLLVSKIEDGLMYYLLTRIEATLND